MKWWNQVVVHVAYEEMIIRYSNILFENLSHQKQLSKCDRFDYVVSRGLPEKQVRLEVGKVPGLWEFTLRHVMARL